MCNFQIFRSFTYIFAENVMKCGRNYLEIIRMWTNCICNILKLMMYIFRGFRPFYWISKKYLWLSTTHLIHFECKWSMLNKLVFQTLLIRISLILTSNTLSSIVNNKSYSLFMNISEYDDCVEFMNDPTSWCLQICMLEKTLDKISSDCLWSNGHGHDNPGHLYTLYSFVKQRIVRFCCFCKKNAKNFKFLEDHNSSLNMYYVRNRGTSDECHCYTMDRIS